MVRPSNERAAARQEAVEQRFRQPHHQELVVARLVELIGQVAALGEKAVRRAVGVRRLLLEEQVAPERIVTRW